MRIIWLGGRMPNWRIPLVNPREIVGRQRETVYDKERRIHEGHDDSVFPASTSCSDSASDTSRSTTTDSDNPPLSSSPLDPIRGLSHQFSNLTRFIQANMSPPHSQLSLSPSHSKLSSSAPTFSPQYPQPCHWCDVPEHARIDCVDLGKNIHERNVGSTRIIVLSWLQQVKGSP